MRKDGKTVDVLLAVEDNRADARLIRESLRESPVPGELYVVEDGEEAMAFLRREGKYVDAPRPDLVLLDLNLPRKDGREVLIEVKTDPNLRRIPVIVLSSSEAEEDICRAYDAGANSYVRKPIDLDEFVTAVRLLVRFWLEVARLPEG